VINSACSISSSVMGRISRVMMLLQNVQEPRGVGAALANGLLDA